MNCSQRALLFAGFLLAGLGAFADFEVPEAHYPPLPKLASSPQGFVPQGWGIEVEAKGDLNGDGRPDLLLVLRQKDPANVVANDPDSPGLDQIDTNPRILAVAFARRQGGFDLVLENHDLIPRYDSPTVDDPFSQAGIADGAISVSLHLWANAGTWYTDDRTFTFRYRDRAFRLVAFDDLTTKRNTGETWTLKIDYLAGAAEMTLGSFSDDEVGDKTYRRSLPSSPLKSIDELGDGWDFQPEQADLSWWGLADAEGDG